MKEVINNMIQHPIRTTIIIGGITGGALTIIRAVKKLRS